MGNDNSFSKNVSLYLDKIMKQKYILKTDLLQLKKQLRKLKEQDKKFNNLYNRVTNIANRAGGKNYVKILQSTYADFNALISTDNAP